jgi:hypothetical protein
LPVTVLHGTREYGATEPLAGTIFAVGRFEVDTGQLGAAGGEESGLAAQGLCGAVEAHAGGGAAAAGDGGAGAALSDCGRALSASLAGLADAVAGMGRNLGAAADAYAETDATVVPGA